jgi:hypothetical protein
LPAELLTNLPPASFVRQTPAVTQGCGFVTSSNLFELLALKRPGSA